MRMVHQGLAPKTATKYAVNVFFNIKPIRQEIIATEQVKRGEVPNLPVDSPLLHPLDSKVMVSESEPSLAGQINTFMVHSDPKLVLVPQLLSPEEAAVVRAAGSAPILAEQSAERAALLEAVWHRVGSIAGMSVEQMHCWVSTFMPGGVAEGPAATIEGIGWKVVYVFLDDEFEGGEIIFPGLFQKVLPRLGTGLAFATHSDDGLQQPLVTYTSLPPTLGVKSVSIFSFGYELSVERPDAQDGVDPRNVESE